MTVIKNKKSILILVPSLVGGGAERALINLLSNLDYTLLTIELAVVSYKGVLIDEIPSQVRIIPLFKNDFLVRALAYLQKKSGFNLLFNLRVKQKLRRKYDVSISYIDSNFTDLLFYIKYSGKKIAWVHASYKSYNNFAQYYNNSTYKDKLKAQRYNRLDAIVFVSNDAKDEFIDTFGSFKCMKVIYNYLDIDSIIAKSKAYVPPKKKKDLRFVALGSLYPVKGYDMLINAAKILKDKGYSFEVSILGSGFLEKELKIMVQGLGLDNEVVFMGFHSNPYPYLRAADVFIMTSLSEALPVALSEAMILGVPTLVTDCSGCRELVNNGEFGLMAEQSPESIAVKMEEYLTHRSSLTYYSAKSKEREAKFNQVNIMAQHMQLFRGQLCQN